MSSHDEPTFEETGENAPLPPSPECSISTN
jgi:hypothetical protein